MHSRSISMIDSNSPVLTQNEAISSSSVRNPGLYFLAVTVIVSCSVMIQRSLMGTKCRLCRARHQSSSRPDTNR